MRGWALTLGIALSATPAAAQGLRAPAAPEDAPSTLTTRLRHVSTVVFPETAEIGELFRTGQPIEAPSLEMLAAWDVDLEADEGGIEGL